MYIFCPGGGALLETMRIYPLSFQDSVIVYGDSSNAADGSLLIIEKGGN